MLSDSLETEAVLVVAQPTSKRHALSLERDDVAPDPNVPADHFAQPGRYNRLAVLVFRVEHPAHSNRTVVVQSVDLRLTQQPVVYCGFFGRQLQLSEVWLEDPVAREFTDPPLPYPGYMTTDDSTVFVPFRAFLWLSLDIFSFHLPGTPMRGMAHAYPVA